MASLAGVASASTSATLPTAGDPLKLCVKCHEKIAGRPDYMPQIEVDSHSKGQSCTACHNPHSPLFSSSGDVYKRQVRRRLDRRLAISTIDSVFAPPGPRQNGRP